MTLQRAATPSSSARDADAADAVVAALTVGGALVTAWPMISLAVHGTPVDPLALVAHTSGLLAGYGVLVMLVLMSRWPLLERTIGADVLARRHATGGRIILTLVLLHAVLAVVAWRDLTQQPLQGALTQVLAWPGLWAATIGTALLVAVAAASIRWARRRVPWETWHALHLTTYLAVALSFSHQLAGPDIAGRRWLQLVWGLLYALTFGLVLRHRLLTPVQGALRHRLHVVAVIPEAPGVVSIVLQGRHVPELMAQPGHFLRWRFLTRGAWTTAHPFSLSAPPVGDRLRLTVKALGEGSSRLQRIPLGTRVVAEGPYGAMTAARRTRSDVLLVAGGVGITPMRALFETLVTTPGQQLTLLYRARTPDELVFRRELDTLAAQRQARVVYLLGSRRDLLGARSLQRLVPGLRERDVFLCGPPGMTAAVRASLAQAGVPQQQVHGERFTL